MPKILAIDDSLTIRKLVHMILGGVGHEVLVAEKGQKGIDMAKEHRPDLILLDYVLPDVQSPEICRQLLADPNTAEIPVLLISTNGAAIRQLYADSSNVRDYLTKPFQAKVLQTVVDHLLTKRKPVEDETAPAPEPAATDEPSTPAAVAVPTPPAPASTPSPAATTEPALKPEGPAPAPSAAPSRFGPGAASAIASDGHSGLRALLNARFRGIARMIPELESRRGSLLPETYYLPFLLRNELVAEIVAEVSRTQMSAETSIPLIAGTQEWMGIDTTFFHLARTNASGVFTFRLPAEVIDVTLQQGRVVLVGSNNPRVYCAGAAFNFRAAPPAAIASAVAAQQRDGTPFFVTLARLGAMRDPAAVLALLRTQGVRAVHRAMTTPGTRYAFVPRETLSDAARQFPLGINVRQFVLEVLRRVEDWLEIESTTGSVETIFAVDPASQAISGELSLNAEEAAVAAAVDGQRSAQQIAAATNLDLFGACAAIYRLLKLNFLRVVSAPVVPVAPDPAVEEFLQETAATTWPAEGTAASGTFRQS